MSAALKLPKHFAEDQLARTKWILETDRKTQLTIPAKGDGSFGDIEYTIDCVACGGSGHIGNAAPLGRGCPACKCHTSLDFAMTVLRDRCRTAIDAIRCDQPHLYDGGHQTMSERMHDELALARADMHLIAKAIAAGAR